MMSVMLVTRVLLSQGCTPSALSKNAVSALGNIVFSSQSCGVTLQVRSKHALIQQELGPEGVSETKPGKLKIK